MHNTQKCIIFVVSIKSNNNMDRTEQLKYFYGLMMEVKMKIEMLKFIYKSGGNIPEKDLDALLDRYNTLKKIIEELEKK